MMTTRQIHPDNNAPAICACICTHNGQAVIPGCLDSLVAQDLPADRFTILVIDDGSTDATAETFRAWQENHPGLSAHLITQAASGLSVARNAAIEQCDAPIVAYIDDDAMAEPTWLSGLLSAFAEFPNAAAAAGPVQVRWTTARPRWWRDELDEVFNRFHPADQPCKLHWPQMPYGCNFAVRRDIALALGGFRTDLGRQNGTLLAGEETELLLRTLANKHEIAYQPSAGVQHLALASRATRRYILRRAWMHGRSAALLARRHQPVADSIPPLSRCLWQMLATAWRYRFRLAHWKYWLYRLGYHYQRLHHDNRPAPGHPHQSASNMRRVTNNA